MYDFVLDALVGAVPLLEEKLRVDDVLFDQAFDHFFL
jgi:hypothetical protein